MINVEVPHINNYRIGYSVPIQHVAGHDCHLEVTDFVFIVFRIFFFP